MGYYFKKATYMIYGQLLVL